MTAADPGAAPPTPLVRTLDNGLELLLAPRPDGPPLTSVMLWYRSGAAAELPGHRGAAHLLEHMMFKGTARHATGEIDLLTQRAGGSNNAFTGHDATCYYFALPGDGWQLALELEADRMRGATLDPAELDAERDVVLQELDGELDTPWGALEQELCATAFRRHPYRHPILGWPEDLAAMSADRLRAFYDAHYRPANALLVACGKFDDRALTDRAAELFGALDSGRPSSPPIPPEPPQRGERRIELRDDVGLARLQVVYRTAPFGSDDHLPLLFAETHLSTGKRSQLYRRLVQGGLARSAGASFEAMRDHGMFWLWAELLPGADPEAAEQALHDEVARLGADSLTHDDLARARRQLTTGLLFQQERADSWAEALGRFAILGGQAGIDLLRGGAARIAAVDADDVRRAAATLTPERRTVGRALPA